MTKRLILFDFDETYYKHATTEQDLPYLREMEALLEEVSIHQQAITAILTGSSLESVMAKMTKANMLYQPTHIFSDLASKMYTWHDNSYIESDAYKKEVLAERFVLNDILDIVHAFSHKYDVEFMPQKTFRKDDTHYNFYFYSLGDSQKDVIMLNRLIQYAEERNYTVKYNRCNPLAGDPDHAYDIDFIPKNAGKLFATQFLMNTYNISKSSVIGFGDSGNDEAFLSYINHAFVMLNSTDNYMRSKFKNTKYPYYKGITTHIKAFIDGHYD